MRFLIDENIPQAQASFARHGELQSMPGREIKAADLHDIDVLLVRSVTTVDESLLKNSSVKFVGSCTSGIDHVDTTWLKSAGIQFAHAPGANARSVVEYVIAAMLYAAERRGGDAFSGRAGIVGLGHVGGQLYSVLEQLGMECIGYDPFVGQGPWRQGSLEDVLTCDLVSLHTPLTQSGPHPTRHMIGEEQLVALPDEALLINSCRGSVVDNAALGCVLQTRPDLMAVLDVWEGEPAVDLSLAERLLLATPHIAGYSYTGKVRGTEQVYQSFCQWQDIECEQQLTALTGQVIAYEQGRGFGDYLKRVYDIAEDDQRFREALSIGNAFVPGKVSPDNASRAKTAQEFESLRKNYPKRLEASDWKMQGQWPEDLRRQMTALGFKA